jgi:hypothetical protein
MNIIVVLIHSFYCPSTLKTILGNIFPSSTLSLSSEVLKYQKKIIIEVRMLYTSLKNTYFCENLFLNKFVWHSQISMKSEKV